VAVEACAPHSPDLAAVLAKGPYGRVSAESRAVLLSTAEEVRVAGGGIIPPAATGTGPRPAHGQPGIVIEGLLRIFVRAELRQVTVQYAGRDELFGIPALRGDGGVSGITAQAQALVDSRVLLFRPDTVEDLIAGDAVMADVTIRSLRVALYTGISLMAENVLSPLRQRIARHLLDLAVQEGGEVLVPVTVQDLAHATGTVREVVTRVLKDMREHRLIGRKGGSLVLLDLPALHLAARGELNPGGGPETRG
jgi:CRP/FNR family transcriptional regulator, cyclic AMP receptor protein